MLSRQGGNHLAIRGLPTVSSIISLCQLFLHVYVWLTRIAGCSFLFYSLQDVAICSNDVDDERERESHSLLLCWLIRLVKLQNHYIFGWLLNLKKFNHRDPLFEKEQVKFILLQIICRPLRGKNVWAIAEFLSCRTAKSSMPI